MKIFVIKSVYFFSIVILTTGCSLFNVSQQPNKNLRLTQAYTYLAHKSLNSLDFEQFEYNNKTLFAECGRIFGGQHSAQEQRVINLTPEQIINLTLSANNLNSSIDKAKLSLDPPGNLNSMLDPGILILELKFNSGKSTNIKTSLNSISDGQTAKEKNIEKFLIETRRLFGHNPCGMNSFYGLAPLGATTS